MIDIKGKIKELCKNHVEESVVESFLNKQSSSSLYDDLIKDKFTDGDSFDLNDNYAVSVWKFEDNIEYTLLDYTDTTDENGQPKELNSFVLKNSNPNPTNVSFG
ncbi:MAG: hypothetical protein FP820_11620 [Sulfurimonas sp.]|nr:hypothetical protein [Sulfurimonas sp.]MBU1216944.1 hypothetical protein [bacterium]MBU1435071.1 hypothetical protein [bacterium]MBU1504176.1 hypothetical protein [bacterium]MBU3938166.1 hypothetical protein [bacterium]